MKNERAFHSLEIAAVPRELFKNKRNIITTSLNENMVLYR